MSETDCRAAFERRLYSRAATRGMVFQKYRRTAAREETGYCPYAVHTWKDDRWHSEWFDYTHTAAAHIVGIDHVLIDDDINPRDVTAYHEAGHAYAALFLGRKIEHAKISADGRTGRVTLDEDDCHPLRSALISISGPWAEARRSRDLDPQERPLRDWLLYTQANSLSGDMSNYWEMHAYNHELKRGRSRMRTEAWWYGVLESYWPAVDSVAKALLEKGALDHDTAAAIVRDGEKHL